jgi:ribonuclease P protein component
MLAKKNRFFGQPALLYAIRKGIFCKAEYFDMKILTINNLHNRAAVVVSKKISKRAVDRNYIRRKVYSALGAKFSEGQGKDVIIFVKDMAITNQKFSDLEKELHSLL